MQSVPPIVREREKLCFGGIGSSECIACVQCLTVGLSFPAGSRIFRGFICHSLSKEHHYS